MRVMMMTCIVDLHILKKSTSLSERRRGTRVKYQTDAWSIDHVYQPPLSLSRFVSPSPFFGLFSSMLMKRRVRSRSFRRFIT